MLTLHRKKQKIKTRKKPKTIIKRQTKKNPKTMIKRRYTKRSGGKMLIFMKGHRNRKKKYGDVKNYNNEFENLKRVVGQKGLKYVNNKFKNFIESNPDYYKEILIAAVEQYGVDELENVNLYFIITYPRYYKEIVIAFVKQDGRVLEYVNKDFILRYPDYYKEIAIAAVEQDGLALKYVDIEFIKRTIKRNPKNVKPHYYDIAIEAVKQNGRALRHVHINFITTYPEYYVEIEQESRNQHSRDLEIIKSLQGKYYEKGNESGNESEKGN